MKSAITTHVLDLSIGKPAQGLSVTLVAPSDKFSLQGITDKDGRIALWDREFELNTGIWTLCFSTNEWFNAQQLSSFFSDVFLSFKVDDLTQHYHVPLLLNRFGYSTYRGS